MRAAGRSKNFLVWGLVAVFWAEIAGAATRAHPLEENTPVDLASNFRLIMGAPDGSNALALCIAMPAGVSGTDPYKLAAAVADVETRRDFVSRAFHEHFGDSPAPIRSLDVLNADMAAICIDAPASSLDDALSVVLEALRPSALTPQRWSGLVQRWQNQEGLAATIMDNRLQHRLQSLVWLGNPDATTTVPRIIEQSLNLPAERVARNALTRPAKVVITVVGEYSPVALGKAVRANPLTREFTHAQIHGSVQPPGVPETKMQTPRFTRERVESADGHVWLFGWPISHLDTARVSRFIVVAQMLERHLNEQTSIGKAAVVSCSLQIQRTHGTFIVEVRSKSLDLETVDKGVRAAIERLKGGQFSRSELSNAITNAKDTSTYRSRDLIDRAWSLAADSFLPRVDKDMGNVDPSEISRIARQELDLAHGSELFAEALPPRPKAVSAARQSPQLAHRVKGTKAGLTVPGPTNRRPGRIYTLKNGESLQMIARRFQVSVAEIIRENRLSHPDQIRPGTKIFVPQPGSSVKLAK